MTTVNNQIDGLMVTLNGQNSVKVEGNTYLRRRDDGKLAIMLYGTEIAVYDLEAKTCALNSDNYRTKTTLQRMNAFSPANVVQVDGAWYIVKRTSKNVPVLKPALTGSEFSIVEESESEATYYPFHDGIRVSFDGTPIDVEALAKPPARSRRRA